MQLRKEQQIEISAELQNWLKKIRAVLYEMVRRQLHLSLAETQG